jgi:hypothetical protein
MDYATVLYVPLGRCVPDRGVLNLDIYRQLITKATSFDWVIPCTLRATEVNPGFAHPNPKHGPHQVCRVP